MLDLNHRSLSSKLTLADSTLATPQYRSNIARLAGGVMGATEKKSRRILTKNALKI